MLTLHETRHLSSCCAFHAQGQFKELHNIKSLNISKEFENELSLWRPNADYNASVTSMTFTGSRLLVFTVSSSHVCTGSASDMVPPPQSVTAAEAKQDNVAVTLSVLGGLALALQPRLLLFPCCISLMCPTLTSCLLHFWNYSLLIDLKCQQKKAQTLVLRSLITVCWAIEWMSFQEYSSLRGQPALQSCNLPFIFSHCSLRTHDWHFVLTSNSVITDIWVKKNTQITCKVQLFDSRKSKIERRLWSQNVFFFYWKNRNYDPFWYWSIQQLHSNRSNSMFFQ